MRRLWATCGALLWICLTFFPSALSAQDNLSLDLKVGLEGDNNAGRSEGPQADPDLLTRYFLKLEAAHAVSRGQRLSLKFRSGGKFYREEVDENTLINQVDINHVISPLEAFDQRWLFLFVRGSFKDRLERGGSRDYQRGGGAAGLGLGFGDLTLRAAVGASIFLFKPDPALSSRGPSSELGASLALGQDWVARAGFSVREKSYQTMRLVSRDETGQVVRDENVLREDLAQIVSAGLTWRGPVVSSLDLSWVSIASNSHGQSIERLGAAVTLTAPLPWSVFLSGRLSLQRTNYADELFVSTDKTLAIDEDNRNTFVLELERPLSELLSVVARYSVFAQEFGVEEADYNRQLIFLGMGVQY